MNKLYLTAAAAVMLLLFIKDSPITKKIWLAVTAVASAAAVITITVVYCQFGTKLQKINYEYIDKAKWQSDFNTYMLCVVALLLIASAVFVYAYSKSEKFENNDNYDSYAEYIVIGMALVIAMVLYFIGTAFAVSHISKYFDVSYYSVAISTASVGIIIINILMYMKTLQ